MHDLKPPPALRPEPLRERAGVALIRPYQLHAWEFVVCLRVHEPPRATAVVQIRTVDTRQQHESRGVYKEVALAPFEALRAVIATLPSADWLSITAAPGLGARPSVRRTGHFHGRPQDAGGGTSGASSAHSASDKSDEYGRRASDMQASELVQHPENYTPKPLNTSDVAFVNSL